VAGTPARDWNLIIGWTCMAVGVGTGLILGLWSFDGPVAVPEWIGAYGDTSRRLIRLGHIAFIGLGISNILLSREMPRLALGAAGRRLASIAMNFGNIFLPVTLFAAGAYRPAKFLMALPATSVFLALILAAYGTRRALAPRSEPDDRSASNTR
jgi:hypothetical protein